MKYNHITTTNIAKEFSSKKPTTSRLSTAPSTISSIVRLTTLSGMIEHLQTTDLNRIITQISTTSSSTLISQEDVTPYILENTTPSTNFTTGQHSITSKKPPNEFLIEDKTIRLPELELNTVSSTMLSAEKTTVESSTNHDEKLENSNTPFHTSTSIPETVETTKTLDGELISTLTTTSILHTNSNRGKKSININTDQRNVNDGFKLSTSGSLPIMNGPETTL